MAVQPFFKVVVEDNSRDISDLITGFSYDRDAEKDDILKLSLEFQSVEGTDDEDLVEGKKLIFKYGIVGGKVSKKRKVKIKSSIPEFGAKIKLNLVCHDLGTDTKRNSGQTIYKGKTSSQIASIIADNRGLGKNITTTKKIWKDMPQGNKSEFELLKYLADREDNGDFIIFISDNVLNFIRRDLTEKSIITYTYEDGDDTVISFKPSYKEAETDAGASATSVSDHSVVENNATVEQENLGEEMVHYDQDAFEIGRSGGKAKKGREIVTPTQDKEEATNIAKGVKKKSALKSLVGKLLVEIDPLLEVNRIITIKGVGQKYSGNWYISGITDGITATGTSALRLSKNSTKKSLRDKTDTNVKSTVNKDVGPNETGATVDIINYDQDGNELDKNGKLVNG